MLIFLHDVLWTRVRTPPGLPSVCVCVQQPRAPLFGAKYVWLRAVSVFLCDVNGCLKLSRATMTP